MKCSVCGCENQESNKFCAECGTGLTGSSSLTGRLGPDTMLGNRYIIVKMLGRGGMGAVYLALDTRLNNVPVAVKEMSIRAVGGDLQAAIGSFKKEASMLINLRHPSLPRILDFFSKDEDRWYLVMDYIEGQTLKEIADKRGPIPEAEVLDWGCQLCGILDYLHKQAPPIIFRDLKPANIMLTPQGQIKLIDFGIARHFRAGSNFDTRAYGSNGFAPPEQYGENQTDPRSDIYALGATLHYLLTGQDPQRTPFFFDDPSKTVKVSSQLETVIMQALELKVADRHQNVGQMLKMLSQIGLKTAQVTKGDVKEDKGDQPKSASNSQTTPWQLSNQPIGNKGQSVTAAMEPVTNQLNLEDSITLPQVSQAQSVESKKTLGTTSEPVCRPNPLFNKVIKAASFIAAVLIILILAPPIYGTLKCNNQPKLELVKVEDKWGFNNLAGEEIIKPQFDNPPAFCDGLAAVEVNGKWGFIDTSGDYAIEPQYDQVSYFINGQAAVNTGGKTMMIDKHGNPE